MNVCSASSYIFCGAAGGQGRCLNGYGQGWLVLPGHLEDRLEVWIWARGTEHGVMRVVHLSDAHGGVLQYFTLS